MTIATLGVTAADTDSDAAAGRPLLEVRELHKSFNGVSAVDGLSFDVAPETITGLIGPNGAGKSTAFDLITGVLHPDAGQVRFDGTDITRLSPDRVADRGLVRTFQLTRVFRRMTVLENLMVAPPDQHGETLWRAVMPWARAEVRREERAHRERAWETLEFFELDHLAHDEAATLSGGQRKLLELARALMTEPDMLLLDEPLAGVNPTLSEKLLDRIHTLRGQGYTFLLVEHDMDVVMNHCNPVIVMHQGRTIVEGPPDVVQTDERVLDAYLGGEVDT